MIVPAEGGRAACVMPDETHAQKRRHCSRVWVAAGAGRGRGGNAQNQHSRRCMRHASFKGIKGNTHGGSLVVCARMCYEIRAGLRVRVVRISGFGLIPFLPPLLAVKMRRLLSRGVEKYAFFPSQDRFLSLHLSIMLSSHTNSHVAEIEQFLYAGWQ